MSEIYILGSGAMASALAKGLCDNYEVTIVARDITKNIISCSNIKIISYDEFNLEDKNIILAFKPYALDEVASKLSGKAKWIISVLANTSFEKLHIIQAQNYVKIMPNIAAKFKASATPYLMEKLLFNDEILALLNTFGKAFLLQNEKEFDIAMVLSGCAPAFLSLVAESLANAGVRNGLNNTLSYELTRSTFESFSALFNKEHPALIKEKICSPAGVTIKGIEALEKKAVRAAFFEAFLASMNK
ncbi:pyrroline-5-carboxylate reductase [Campylobacter insulaenigrae]|uniref:Pyrroline-5-carboxylate reductase n=1 Tax=Campylobacter insulaenigrae TaxID=260714 RepID=A0ABY3G4E6_9BACT|nr:pyrroline-5-carboxylate reductase [Campylobacter insulaenigrae]MCR6570328.1 pyrroline-5-carboxylate reductase [Campylobacter insulaenigrae]MCR6571730.1 pyrroline-5-carboxylate reductase [Campylobacter insulaenigrae]MCR6573367.1 pyrroline-5-carboxylate reductase [Campylobacter insulaenigrae]MCR6574832.1 pyrroline-5-carboxylate reductase [Campylobacter insulaenigrae]MCR6576476.1 pyrroline-5-carboxylate reductase [Campylobacter insulaenigrae]